MIKEIIHDPILLGIKSSPATIEDISVAQDLLDTLKANSDRCVGMAANMIGVNKRIICFNENGKLSVMFNPEITAVKNKYETEEGCLSLTGTRKTIRYKQIKVRFENEDMKPRTKNFDGFTAQIIQHEIDHCNGILI